jgi:signal transduction histidine kinase
VIPRWVTRIFDDRYAWLRMTLLGLSGIGYLIARDEPADPFAPIDWVFAVAAIALCPVPVWWPLAGSVASSVVFAAASWFGQAEPIVPQVGATWVLVELALRAPAGRQLALGSATLVVASIVDHTPDELSSWPFDFAITMGVPLLVGLNIRTSRQLARQAEDRVAVEAKAARTSERAAIARELHDLVAHHVASMVLRVGIARHVLRDAGSGVDPRVGEVFDDLHASGTAALADLRRLVAVLRNPATVSDAYLPIDPGSLPAALVSTVDRAVKTGLTVDATIDPAVANLDAVRGLAVLRLTQEGLTNVAKHAGPAARARLCVTMVDDAVHWEITDDGGGARPADAEPGHGLTGMRERVEVLGGTLAAGPESTGWRLQTVLPSGGRP